MSQTGGRSPILAPGRNCLGIYEAGRSGLLVDARDYYLAFAEAARKAERYILIAGWQFDSDVRLLRGEDVKKDFLAGETLIAFFNDLCANNPSLEIFILAWDYSVIFALEREWFQKWVFNKKTHENIHFRFDSNHATGASHHQKYVVIDGMIGFAGGMDICADRWDDRKHRCVNPYRADAGGESYGPYHDIQAFVSGPVAQVMTDFFAERWATAGGGHIDLQPASGSLSFRPKRLLLIDAGKVAISRTEGKTVLPLRDSIREIRSLYLDAISGAEQSIYLENQYFSSQAVFSAFRKRLTQADRPRLEIVMIFPRKPEAFIEELSMGLAQARIFTALKETAALYGHSLGIYYTSAPGESGRPGANVYIHSKLLIVDDRFLMVGSANTTNRSMGLDTELNLSWEATGTDDESLVRSIRDIRKDLLAEHTGIWWMRTRRHNSPRGMVDYLDRIADKRKSRLSRLETGDYLSAGKWLKDMTPEDLAIDPESPIIEESIFEMISVDKSGLFAKGITVLNAWLSGRTGMSSPEVPVKKDEKEPRSTNRLSVLAVLVLMAGTFVFFLFALLLIRYFFS